MKTKFNNFFGNSLKIKVIEFLIEGRELDYSISDIAEGAGIGRTTLFRIWNDFVESGIVKNTRNIGNAKLYKLNLANPFARKMADLFDMSEIFIIHWNLQKFPSMLKNHHKLL